MSNLTRAQINKAINQKLKSAFSGIQITSRDVEEGFPRPSFFVMLDTNRSDTRQFSRQVDMTARIRFFPTDRYVYKEEIYDVQDILEEIFGLRFDVQDRSITIDSASSVVVDGVLQFDFDFSYYSGSGVEEDSGPLVEELDFNV